MKGPVNYISLLCLLLLTGWPSLAATYLLQGTMGSRKVVLRLDTEEHYAGVRLFTYNELTDLTFEGRISNGIATLHSADSSQSLTLSIKPDKSWAGTLRNKKGTKTPLTLRPLNISKWNHQFDAMPCVQQLKKEDPYNYCKTSLAPIKKDTTPQKIGRYTLHNYTTGISALSRLVFTGGLPHPIIDSVNNTLLYDLLSSVIGYYSCPNNEYLYYEVSQPHFFLNDTLLSIDQSVSWDCGNQAHPNDVNFPINLNLKTGKPLQLEDFIHFPPPASDSTDTSAMEHIILLLQTLHPDKMINKEACYYADETCWYEGTWCLTADGLLLLPDFRHIIIECGRPEWALIPNDDIARINTTGR